MNRHTFRWDSLLFGPLFAAVAGTWAVLEQDVLEQDVLTAQQLSVTGSVALILLGLLGIAATLVKPGSRHTLTDIPKGASREEADPQS